jgi:hypothetical protein
MDKIGELYDVAQALNALELASNHCESVPDEQTRQRMVQGHGYIQGLLADRVRDIAERMDCNDHPRPVQVAVEHEISTH